VTGGKLSAGTEYYRGGITDMGIMAMTAMDAREFASIVSTSKTILVVDDADFIRRLVSIILTMEGYAIIEANNGKEALDMLGNTPVDIIITDLNMPVMDGIELVNALRSEPAYKNIPVVMLTSDFLESRKQKAFDSGINEWVPKPYITSKLRDLVFKYA
jgi:two-component system chemotaxis response regulator CheY